MFGKMKIGMKLYLLVGFLSLLLIAIGTLGLRGIERSNARLATVYDDRLVPVALLMRFNDQRWDNIQQLMQARLHDPKLAESRMHEADHPLTQHTDNIAAGRKENDRLWQQYMATFLTPEEKQIADNYDARRRTYIDDTKTAVALLKRGKFDQASIYITDKVQPHFRETEQILHALIQLQLDVAKNEKDQSDADYDRIRNLSIASIVCGILLALAVGVWIIRGITRKLTASVSAISSSASELAATIAQHERTASQQATAANETSATIEELSASSRKTAEQAANSAAVAERAGTATAQGDETTRLAVEAMSSLKEKIDAMAEHILHLGEQTGQIGNIATVLKDLAGQINMLALNAAVEAARAGEHGKGFAVVASEIRKLADESKKSAEQTAVLVTDVQKATNSSIMMTEEGSHTVTEVTRLVRKVAELFGNLASLAGSANENAQQVMLNAQQQSAAFSQVAEATNSIVAGTRETASGISQTKIGVQNLNEAAENLKAIA